MKPNRLCIIGNSHAACLKSAWDRIGWQFRPIQVTFFADRGSNLANLKIEDNRLVPTTVEISNTLKYTSGGKNYIDPSEFDACLIYGLGFLHYKATSDFYSDAVLRQAVADHLGDRLAWRILAWVRTLSSIPLFVGHLPLPAREGPEPREAVDLATYEAGVVLMNTFGLGPKSARLLSQPPETLASNAETKTIYSQGSRRLDVGDAGSGTLHPPLDRAHMNEDFGKIYLKHALAEIFPGNNF